MLGYARPLDAARRLRHGARQAGHRPGPAARTGRYDEAIARFAAVQAPTALRVQALKHTAFSYCVTNRLPSCQRAFQDALALAPGFRLSKAERGHPVWGPVFDKALLQSQPARRRR